jgi:NhaP-type Na+/H+ or K+/H+ antiporter
MDANHEDKSHGDDKSHDDGGHGSGKSDEEAFALPHLIFMLFILCAAVLVRYLLETVSTRLYKPPFTVIMGIIGLLCGMVNNRISEGGLWHRSVLYWGEVHPSFILFILLPPLLFESAFSMKWHTFRHTVPSALLLAGPGVIFSTALSGLAAMFLYSFTDGWNLNAAFLIGSILSATGKHT